MQRTPDPNACSVLSSCDKTSAKTALFPKLRVHCPFYTRAPIHPRVILCSTQGLLGKLGGAFSIPKMPVCRCSGSSCPWSWEGRSGGFSEGGGPETRSGKGAWAEGLWWLVEECTGRWG